jgi:phospholipase C
VETFLAGLMAEGLEDGAVAHKGHSTMSRFAWLSISILLFCGAGFLLSLNACGGGKATFTVTPPPPPSSSKIQHVVIIFQENRTPDSLFHDQNLISAGADIASSGVNSQGETIALSPIDLGTNGSDPDNYDLSHAHSAFVKMCDLNGSGACNMDGADLIDVACAPGVTGCAPANPQFMYVNPADVQPYFTMAEQYTFADRMFQTNQGPSFPAHQFIISGTSAPAAGSPLFVAENPSGTGTGTPTGCTAPSTETVSVINSMGIESANPPIYPCFEHPTLTDLLKAANVSWRYYTPSAGSIWTAPNAIDHMCGPNAGNTACTGSDWTNNVVLANTQVLTDITNGNLAAVSWVIPTGLESDHALSNDGSGPSWVTSVVNAIGNSTYWSNTAIFVVWDDWGGWYDHVPPPQVLAGPNCVQWGCGYVYGFRVPMIVISPYAKTAYISHVPHDFGSILKFIENTYGLPSISSANGGYADSNALDDLSDCFNFNQTPVSFRTVEAPLKADYFMNDRRPPTDPDDD